MENLPSTFKQQELPFDAGSTPDEGDYQEPNGPKAAWDAYEKATGVSRTDANALTVAIGRAVRDNVTSGMGKRGRGGEHGQSTSGRPNYIR